MSSKRSVPELTLPVPPASKSNFIKALKSPIKMLPKAAPTSTSPTKTKPPTDSPPQQQPRRPALATSNSMSSSGPIPTLTIHRASTITHDPFTDAPPPTWTCCACTTHHHLTLHPGPHPLGTLSCPCTHKPCTTCTTSGPVQPFLATRDPAMVPRPDDDDDDGAHSPALRYGIVCPGCGLSWRARELGTRPSKTLRKMPSVSVARAAHLAPVESRLRKSRSTLVLGNKRVVTPPGTPGVGRAGCVAVRFGGVTCECGVLVLLKSALCFQIVGGMVEERERGFWGLWVREGKAVGWTTTQELREKGHGTPMLRFGAVGRGGELGEAAWKVEHPNPLRSAPVVDKMARESWEEKCDREGWV